MVGFHARCWRGRSRRSLIALLCLFGLGLRMSLAAGGQVTLNLKNADISALIDTVAEITGKNFIVDPRVKGKVTVVSSAPMDHTQIYAVFLQILQVHGFTAIDDGTAIKIVPLQAARTDSVPTITGKHRVRRDEIVTRLVEVHNVQAAQLIPVLRPLVPQTGHLAAAPASNVIAITDTAANVARLVRIIERMDVARDRDIAVIPLRHASAADIVREVSSMVASRGRQDQAPDSQPMLEADRRTNSVLVRGDWSEVARLRRVIEKLDSPAVQGGKTQVVYLRYAKAHDLVDVLEGVVKNQEQRKVGRQGTSRRTAPTTIQADPSVNALVLTGPPDVIKNLRRVVHRLDVRRAQVLVEALIAEISEDRAAELGIQWRVPNTADTSGAFGGTNFNLTGNGINQLSAGPSSVGDGLSLGVIDGSTAVLGTKILNLGTLIRALQASGAANILSTPSLVTLDNEEAKIVVGQSVPFVTGKFTSTGTGQGVTSPFETIQRQDVGLTLKVKPQITQGNTVRLDIEQEVSSIAPATTSQNAADIITNKRSIDTSVLVDDGKIVVLGGLIDDQVQQNVQKVPLLGDLPMLGRLFRYDHTSKVKRNLMVFLHPTILRDGKAHEMISKRSYNDIRDLESQRDKEGVDLMPRVNQPVLEAPGDVPGMPGK